jgi:hypothetical protein
MPAPTFLDLAASIDNELKRNVRWPSIDITFADTPFAMSVLSRIANVDASGGAVVATLPSAVATVAKGMFFYIKKTDASANPVTVQCAVGGQTIDGAGSVILTAEANVLMVYADGANYRIVVLTAGGSGGAGVPINGTKSIVKTDGVSTLVPVDGTLINFTTVVAGECSFWAAGVWAGLSFAVAGGSLNFRIDGVDYAPLTWAWNNGSGGDTTSAASLSPHITLPLAAGAHTVELVASNTVLALQADATNSLSLTVQYPAFSGAAPAGPGVASSSTFASRTAGDVTLVAGAGWTLIPDTLVTLDLEIAGNVIINASAWAFDFVDPAIVKYGVRVDGVDVALSKTERPAPTATDALPGAGTLGILLSAGPHTIQMIARDDSAGGGATVSGTATDPASVTVQYPVPGTGFPTPKAATFVVSGTPGVGDFTTIQAAINALPAEGGFILVREGVYSLAAENSLPDKAIQIVGCGSGFDDTQGTVIDIGANAINAFHQTGTKHILLANMRIRSDGTAGSRFYLADNPSGAEFLDINNVVVDGFELGFENPLGTLLVRVAQFYWQSFVTDPIFWNGAGQVEGSVSQATGGRTLGAVSFLGNDFNLLLDSSATPNQVQVMNLSNSFIAGQWQISAGGAAFIAACAFVQIFTTPDRYIDVAAGALRSAITGCTFVPATVEEIRTAGDHLTVAASAGSPTLPRVTETGAADSNIFNEVDPASTIIGPLTRVNDALCVDSTDTTGDAYVTIAEFTNPKGLGGVGTIINTDGANSLTIKETVTDRFGNTAFLETAVPFGTPFLLDTLSGFMSGGTGTGFPPYKTYKAEVKSTVVATPATYEFHFSGQGAM